MKKFLGPLRSKSKGLPSSSENTEKTKKHKQDKRKNSTGETTFCGENGVRLDCHHQHPNQKQNDCEEETVIVVGSGAVGSSLNQNNDSDDTSCMKTILRTAYLPVLLRGGDSGGNKRKKKGGSGSSNNGGSRNTPNPESYGQSDQACNLVAVGRCESWSAGTKPSVLSCLVSGNGCPAKTNDKKKGPCSGQCSSTEALHLNGSCHDPPAALPLDRTKSASATFFGSTRHPISSSSSPSRSPMMRKKKLGSSTGTPKVLYSSSPKMPIFANDVNRHLYTTLVGVISSKAHHGSCSDCSKVSLAPLF